MTIKLNIKYEWCSREKPLFPIVSHFKRNNRKIKKGLKTALIDISNTLNIHDWNITMKIRDNGIKDDIIQYYIAIELQSKTGNINGSLRFVDMQELLSKKFNDVLLNRFYYIHHENTFYHELFSKKYTFLLVLTDFPKLNQDDVIYFTPIDNKGITTFKNEHEDFIRYIHENLYTFDLVNTPSLGSQLFFICDQIYWNSSYSFPYEKDEVRFSNPKNIKDNDRNTFLRSLIEAGIININQDIEEVLAWDIKDIFAMSKLIDY